jgi:hypothetical protein
MAEGFFLCADLWLWQRAKPRKKRFLGEENGLKQLFLNNS